MTTKTKPADPFEGHTPTPWKSGGCVIYDANGMLVFDLVSNNMRWLTADSLEQRVDKIVHHVNGYAALEAENRRLREAMPFISDFVSRIAYAPDPEIRRSPLRIEADDLLKRIRAALADANEGRDGQ